MHSVEDVAAAREAWLAEGRPVAPKVNERVQAWYYHVRLSVNEQSRRDRYLLDLSDEALEPQVLVPYFEGHAIVDDGVITKVGDIAQIQIIRTEQPSGKLPRRTPTAEGFVYVGNGTWRSVISNGTDVTNEFINGAPGRPAVEAIEQEHLPLPAPIGAPYVDAKVVETIRTKDGQGRFDVTKLLALVNELNDNYASRHTYASHALLRAVLDHVPPAFGHANFREVANNYPWKPTDKRYMKKLADFRDQADDALHRQISAKADLLSFDDRRLD